MHKIFALLTGETFVLIAALLLFAYVKKNDIGKWLQYGAAAIAIFIMVIMIGSVFTCCMPCYGGSRGGHDKGNDHCSMMKGGQEGGCQMGGMNCGGMNSCPMQGKMNGQCSSMEGMNEDCCANGNMDHCEMGDMKEVKIEISDDSNAKDSVQKKVIIKKKVK